MVLNFKECGEGNSFCIHFYPNKCVHPTFPYPDYGLKHLDWKEATGRWDATLGLTDIGRKVVEKCLDLGILIDITHCTPVARSEIYKIVKQNRKNSCIIASHAGSFSIKRDLYNLEDWEVRWIADNGGVIGTIFMNYWLAPTCEDMKLGLKYLSQTIEHLVSVGGEDVVGIGTDFDGFTDPPDEIIDASQMPRFTKMLMSEFKSLNERKYSDKTIEKILGGNAMRVLLDGWKKKT